ncbi:MAG: DUF86 domain-containing protein [Dethiobacter sp.]|nr:DUF86 domain-containing protein [Dethiobacter sp.]
MRYRGEGELTRDIDRLGEALKDWQRYLETVSLRQLLDSRDTRNMVLYAMLITIQAAIRTAHHLIVRAYLPKPGSYEETFLILREHGVLEAKLADAMAQLAIYRQELLHSHHQIDLREIYEVLCNSAQTLELYKVKLEQLVKDKY